MCSGEATSVWNAPPPTQPIPLTPLPPPPPLQLLAMPSDPARAAYTTRLRNEIVAQSKLQPKPRLQPFARPIATMGLRNAAINEYPIMLGAANAGLMPRIGNLIPAPITIATNARIATAITRVTRNRDAINETAEKYRIPAETIGSIIFQEQVARRQPDWMSNLNTASDGQILRPIMDRTYHSTGLGAIFPQPARVAWDFVNPSMELPDNDRELQLKLTHDNNFNVESIAVVLIHKAHLLGYINHPSEINNLTPEQWRRVIIRYNAIDYDQGVGYSRRVHSYMPYIQTLLERR